MNRQSLDRQTDRQKTCVSDHHHPWRLADRYATYTDSAACLIFSWPSFTAQEAEKWRHDIEEVSSMVYADMRVTDESASSFPTVGLTGIRLHGKPWQRP